MTTSVLSRQNPYVIGPPVRNQAMFFGREELFQFIADNLRKDAKVILLHGQRRIGKSSVLRQIPAFVGMKDEFFFFRFDLQDQARLPLSQVLRNLAVELCDHPDGRLPVTPPSLAQLQEDPYLFATDFLPQVYRAIVAYGEALEVNPNHFRSLFNKAEATLEIGDFPGAVESFERAYKADPSRARHGYVQALLGDARVKMAHGQHRQARDHFKKALELDPDDEATREGFDEASAAVRRVLAANNPFTTAPVSPADFIGGQEEVATIFSKIRRRGHINISGPAGIGKTSLLRYIALPETWRRHDLSPDSAVVVLLDCRLMGTKNQFWQKLVQLITDAAWKKGEALQPRTRSSKFVDKVFNIISLLLDLGGWRNLNKALLDIAQQGKFLVILLDEFDTLFSARTKEKKVEIASLIRQFLDLLSGSNGEHISTVISSRDPLNELLGRDSTASLLSNFYTHLPLRPLAESEFDAMVSKIPSEFALSEEEKEWAYKVSEGNPQWMQVAFSMLYNNHVSEIPFDLEKMQGKLEVNKATLKRFV